MNVRVCMCNVTVVALLIAWEKLKDPGNGSKMHVLVSKIGGSTLVYMYARYDFLDAAQKLLYMLESEMCGQEHGRDGRPRVWPNSHPRETTKKTLAEQTRPPTTQRAELRDGRRTVGDG